MAGNSNLWASEGAENNSDKTRDDDCSNHP